MTCWYYSQYNDQRWSRGHKARGQGQTLSRPRTGMLEAKDVLEDSTSDSDIAIAVKFFVVQYLFFMFLC